MTQVREDLEATFDHLEAKGWCSGTFQMPDGKVCLEGAAAAVTMGAPNFWGTRRGMVQGAYSTGMAAGYALPGVIGETQWVDVPRENIDRFANVLDALKAQISLLPFVKREESVFTWNDAPFRTADEVKDLVRHAIKAEADK